MSDTESIRGVSIYGRAPKFTGWPATDIYEYRRLRCKAMARARAEGKTWREVGELFGVTHETARSFGKLGERIAGAEDARKRKMEGVIRAARRVVRVPNE